MDAERGARPQREHHVLLLPATNPQHRQRRHPDIPRHHTVQLASRAWRRMVRLQCPVQIRHFTRQPHSQRQLRSERRYRMAADQDRDTVHHIHQRQRLYRPGHTHKMLQVGLWQGGIQRQVASNCSCGVVRRRGVAASRHSHPCLVDRRKPVQAQISQVRLQAASPKHIQYGDTDIHHRHRQHGKERPFFPAVKPARIDLHAKAQFEHRCIRRVLFRHMAQHHQHRGQRQHTRQRAEQGERDVSRSGR